MNEIQIIIKAVDEMSGTMKDIEANLTKSTKEIEKTSNNTADAFKESTGALLVLGNAAASADRIFSSYVALQIRLENASERVTGAQDRLADAQNALNELLASGTASADDLTKAQTAVERASRSLTISQNNQARAQNQVIGTYINMGVQATILIASFEQIKKALIALKVAFLELESSTVILIALAAAALLVVSVFEQYKKNQEAVTTATQELDYANQNLVVSKEAVASAARDIIKAEDDYAESLKVIAKREADVEKAETDLKKIRKELLVLQQGLADEADNWAAAIKSASDYIRGVIQGQTEEEATQLRDIEVQRHEVNLAKVSGDELEIASAEAKLTAMEQQYQVQFADARALAEAEANLVEVKTQSQYLSEQEGVKATQQLYMTGYANIGSFLESIYYPKLNEMFLKSNADEMKAYNDKVQNELDGIQTLIDAEDALTKAKQSAAEAQQKITTAQSSHEKAKENQTVAEQAVQTATINLGNAQSTANQGFFGTTAGNVVSTLINTVNSVVNGIGHLFGFAEGGPVTQTGVAMVHKGEYVVPEGGTIVGDSGGTIVINIEKVYGVDVEDISDALQRKLNNLIRR